MESRWKYFWKFLRRLETAGFESRSICSEAVSFRRIRLDRSRRFSLVIFEWVPLLGLDSRLFLQGFDDVAVSDLSVGGMPKQGFTQVEDEVPISLDDRIDRAG
jgi:hypothetical protein